MNARSETLVGLSLVPERAAWPQLAELAQVADRSGLDLLGIQRHPYQYRFLDAFALIGTLLARTERIRVSPDVPNLALRPPSVRKTANALDVLSGRRFELELGLGGDRGTEPEGRMISEARWARPTSGVDALRGKFSPILDRVPEPVSQVHSYRGHCGGGRKADEGSPHQRLSSQGRGVISRASAGEGRDGMNQRPNARAFCVGLLLGTLLLLFPPPAAWAGHDDGNCYAAAWTESIKELASGSTFSGVEAAIENYWDGTPHDGIVRTLFAWDDYDNHAEGGYAWRDVDGSAKYAWHTHDAGTYDDGTPGSAGALGSFFTFQIDNPSGLTWKWFRGGTRYKQYTFASTSMYNTDKIWANSEVDNKCDTARVEFKQAKESLCSGCGYTQWDDAVDASFGTENPCFGSAIISDTNFKFVHGSEAGETCP